MEGNGEEKQLRYEKQEEEENKEEIVKIPA